MTMDEKELEAMGPGKTIDPEEVLGTEGTKPEGDPSALSADDAVAILGGAK